MRMSRFKWKNLEIKCAVALALALVLALTLTAALAGCGAGGGAGGAGNGAGATQAVELVDMVGREVRLEAPATRVVVLAAADCEILFAIGAGDLIVGRGTYCDYPPEALELPEVASGGETNIEQIIALTPHVAILAKMAQSEEHAEELENAGVRVIVTDAQDIESTYAAIRLVGDVVGMGSEAETLAGQMRDALREVSEDAARAKAELGADFGETAYFEVSPIEHGLWTTGAGTFMNELAALVGMENAFADIEGWAAISEEQVIMRDPYYIVSIAMYFGDGPPPVDEIMGRAGWQGMKALMAGRVSHVDSDAFARPGPRLVDAARELFSIFYGS